MDIDEEIQGLKLLISNCFNKMDKIKDLSDLFQVEIYLKEYLKRYVKLNEERILKNIKILEGS